MSSYAGRHAELYDLFYAQKPYAEEADFVHQQIRDHETHPTRHLLDVACGTGRHAREFARLGYEVVGVDHSESMLEQARSESIKRGANVEFIQRDMRNLEFIEQFDAVTCLFDSIGYVRTNDNLQQVFTSLNRALRAHGLLILEFWHAGAMIRDYSPHRVRNFEVEWGTVERTSTTSMNVAEQTCTVHYLIREFFNDGKHHCFSEEQTNRFFLVQEMDRWLTTHGFEPLSWSSEYTGEPVSLETWHVVVVARKREELPR